MLTDNEFLVREFAIELIESNTNAVTPQVLSLVISAVTDMFCTGKLGHNKVSSCAISALPRLKRKLAQMHWATARVYRARWYGWVWYDEACKSLYVPGGKWAERDGVAFEAEFNGLLLVHLLFDRRMKGGIDLMWYLCYVYVS
jgi:hypothetical protein